MELDDFMAADETFSSVQAFQDALVRDVEQRIATIHLRPLPSKPAAPRGQSSAKVQPGNVCDNGCQYHQR